MTNTLRIERLAATYWIPRDHPAPMRLRARMDDIARSYLADCCSRAIAAAIDPHDPSVWVIDEISLDLLLDVHCAPAADIADFWARKIASAVARVIADGADGVQVVRFASRAAFLAHFLRLLVEERAWQKWYFSEFSSLRSLPQGATVREALLREPHEAEAVLIELARTAALSRVAAVLSRTDQELIVRGCAGGYTGSGQSLKAALRMQQAGGWTDSTVIGLYVRIRMECPGMPAADAASAADHLQRILQWSKTRELRELVRAILQPDYQGSGLNAAERETAMAIRFIAADGGAELINALAENAGGEIRSQSDEELELNSPLGAVFLLAAVLVETPLLLSIFGRAGSPVLRFLLYLMCFHRSFSGAQRDPAVRLAAGIQDLSEVKDPPIELQRVPDTVREIASREDIAFFSRNSETSFSEFALDPQARASLATCAAVLMREFARRLPALGGSSIDYLWRNVLAGEDRLVTKGELIEVRLRPRPLQIVLRMAGLHDRVFELPGCSPRSFVLRFEES